MLVIRRRAGDAIQIGTNIEIEILEITPTRVKLGIIAPPEVTVTRKEVVLTRENNLTASTPPSIATLAWLTSELNRNRKQAGDI